jgi:YcxB-like protein
MKMAVAGDAVQIEYEVTRDDLFAFQLRAVNSSPQIKRSKRKVYAFWFVALLLFSVLPSIGQHGFDIMRANFAFLAISFPTVAFLTWYFDRRQTKRAINELIYKEKPEKGLLGKHKIILNEKEVIESTQVGESRTLWIGVDRLEQTDEYFLIYNSPHSAYLIPKRAFANAQEANIFWESAKLYKQASIV